MRILTWCQVTSDQFHLGNYFGAVKPFHDMCLAHTEAEKFLFVANMHSLNKVQDGSLHSNALNTLKLYLACGIDPDDVFIYNQADIPGHAQLQRVLSCITHIGFMERMHAYKAAVDSGKASEIGVGTFTYPILMAADIMLYDATHVPTGKDQKQHVEYTRDIANKFNHMFGDTFILPQSIISESVGTIPGVDGRKMSKSYNNYIGMLDTGKELMKKIKKIPTSLQTIEEPKDPDTCHIYAITRLFLTTDEDTELRKKYTDGGLSFKRAKDYLYEKIEELLSPIQKKYHEITDEQIITMLAANKDKANAIAQDKINEVYKKIGFTF